MRRYLILSSLLLSVCFVFAQKSESTPLSWFDKEGKSESNFTLQINNNEITGICITKRQGDELIGTIVNEFGIKAFDFKYNLKSKKGKLLNVIAFMNKWYIKRIVKADLKYLFFYPEMKKQKKRKVTVGDNFLLLENLKYNIKYTFTANNS